LKAAQRPPIAFVDNNSAKWGETVDGIPVLSPHEAVATYGNTALFVVTIYTGACVRTQLQELGCKYPLHFADLYHGLPDILLPLCNLADPAETLAAKDDVIDTMSLWADDESRTEYTTQIAWRLGATTPSLPAPHLLSECYFPHDLFTITEDGLVVDCGAFDGDSLRLLLARQSTFGGFLGLEPDPETYKRLTQFVGTLPTGIKKKVSTRQCAVASAAGTLRFDASGSVASGISANGNTTVQALTLDDLLEGQKTGLIKMDVEGAEYDALLGARKTLVRDTPILAISAYHKASDLWNIPRLIKSIVPDYDLYLRRYAEDCWELVCYAVPSRH
jgi:FkbM family methyltransferase